MLAGLCEVRALSDVPVSHGTWQFYSGGQDIREPQPQLTPAGVMGSGPSQGMPSRPSHSRPRKPVKRLWPFNCCKARTCVTPTLAILPNDYEKKWKRNFRYRYLLLSHASLQRLEASLLKLSYKDFQDSCEWEKFQLWLQEVLYRVQWESENPVGMAGREPGCAYLQRKRPRKD